MLTVETWLISAQNGSISKFLVIKSLCKFQFFSHVVSTSVPDKLILA